MNDKIYELAKQAGLVVYDSIPGSAAVTPDYESVVRARKFAELIVKECLDIVDDEGSHEGGSIRAMKKIREHFGVIE